MLAARYYGINDIRVEDIPRPGYGADEVLIRVKYAGICGSDLHIYRKGMFMESVPETMGHEFVGVIEETGNNVTGFSVGDHVIGDPRVSCGTCPSCKEGKYNLCPDVGFIGEVAPGCFAEYVVLKPQKLLPVPAAINFREAALVEPLAVALHIARLGDFDAAGRVGIIGAGPIGLLTLIVARDVFAVESVKLVDIDRSRLELGAELGAGETLTAPEGMVNTAVEAAGKEVTLTGAIDWLEPEGRLVIAAVYEEEVRLDPNILVGKEVRTVGSHAYSSSDLADAVDLISKKQVDISPVISHVLPLEAIEKGFSLLLKKEKEANKILLKP